MKSLWLEDRVPFFPWFTRSISCSSLLTSSLLPSWQVVNWDLRHRLYLHRFYLKGCPWSKMWKPSPWCGNTGKAEYIQLNAIYVNHFLQGILLVRKVNIYHQAKLLFRSQTVFSIYSHKHTLVWAHIHVQTGRHTPSAKATNSFWGQRKPHSYKLMLWDEVDLGLNPASGCGTGHKSHHFPA